MFGSLARPCLAIHSKVRGEESFGCFVNLLGLNLGKVGKKSLSFEGEPNCSPQLLRFVLSNLVKEVYWVRLGRQQKITLRQMNGSDGINALS